MNKDDVKILKMIKPSVMPAIISTVILLGVLVTCVLKFMDGRADFWLSVIASFVLFILTAILWNNYIILSANYKDAQKKIENHNDNK